LTDNHILIRDDIQEFISSNDFGNALKILLEQQKSTWLQLNQGYSLLDKVKTKSFQFNGFEIKIQFNPGRLKSSSAKVDEESVKERKCFLCIENLPDEQKGIIYKDDFFILANPYPIFPEHFTISSIKHVPQAISGNFSTMMHLAKDLSKYYTVFYNGPKCGASAPDHMHFQACSKNIMPLESEMDQVIRKYGELLSEKDNASIFSVDDGIRRFFAAKSNDISFLVNFFNRAYKSFQDHSMIHEEPMMNLLVNYKENQWRLLIFFREKHRPSLYDKGVLWSPAAVDLGGLAIFPLEEDFDVISKSDLILGFNEIIISKEIFSYIKRRLKEPFI